MKSRKISMVIALAAAASIAAITAFLSSGAAPSPKPETGQSAPVQTAQAPTVEQSGEYGWEMHPGTAETRGAPETDNPQFTAGMECETGQYQGDRIMPGSIGQIVAGPMHSTGFVIREDGLMATAAHSVSGHTTTEVRLGNRTYTGDVVMVHRKVDVALVQIRHDGETFQSLRMPPKEWLPMGKLTIVGFPRMCYAEYRGYALPQWLREERLFVDVHVQGGASGAPVMDRHGIVVGLVYGYSITTRLTSGAIIHGHWYHDRNPESWVHLAQVDW